MSVSLPVSRSSGVGCVDCHAPSQRFLILSPGADPMHPGCERSIKVTGNAMDSAGRKSRKPAAVIKGMPSEC